MNPKKHYVKSKNKWNDYYLDNIEYRNCPYCKGRKCEQSLVACSCEDIRLDATSGGKIKRKRGSA